MARYKLKLKRLDFISAVDTPAQETATALLVKRRPGAVGNVQWRERAGADIEATARVVKTSSDELGLVFGWALTSKAAGADYFDLHGDNVVEDDLIRVAAEFMESGGASDEMHDFETDGRVVFAMPLTAEVAKSFGIETDTTGLMVAIKPSPEVFAKFKSGEYTGFSIAGIGERIEVKSARVQKAQLFTDLVAGHQHKVCVYEDGSLYVEYATMEGAEYGHSHGIVFENGALTILADSGHVHALAEGQPGLAVVPADAIVVVQARANPTTNPTRAATPSTKSTRSAQPEKVDTMKTIVLTEAQHAHYSKLSGEAAESFLAKSFDEREAVLADIAKSDPVVFKGDLTGVEVRKSQGDLALKLAQSLEATEKRARDASAAAEVEKSARELTELKKRAAETMPNLAGSDDVHCAILKAVEGIADQKLRDEAITALKAANDAAKSREKAPGFGGTEPEGGSAAAKLDALTQKHMADHKVDRPTARVEVMKTAEGKRLYAESVGRA